MSGGDLPPRQKMIGMMYLVLTALLAMNVSKSILDAFVNINSGIQLTGVTIDANNGFVYQQFDKARATGGANGKLWAEKSDKVIGTSTVSAIQSGIFWGYVDLIDGLVARLKAEYQAPMTVVATGGIVSLFEGASRTIDHYDPDLTIRGLYEIWKLNGGKS